MERGGTWYFSENISAPRESVPAWQPVANRKTQHSTMCYASLENDSDGDEDSVRYGSVVPRVKELCVATSPTRRCQCVSETAASETNLCCHHTPTSSDTDVRSLSSLAAQHCTNCTSQLNIIFLLQQNDPNHDMFTLLKVNIKKQDLSQFEWSTDVYISQSITSIFLNLVNLPRNPKLLEPRPPQPNPPSKYKNNPSGSKPLHDAN